MGQEPNPACNAGALQVAEKLSWIVDEYVMAITEGLCTLDKRHSRIMRLPEVDNCIARILTSLDVLDALMSNCRSKVAPDDAIPSALIGRRRA